MESAVDQELDEVVRFLRHTHEELRELRLQLARGRDAQAAIVKRLSIAARPPDEPSPLEPAPAPDVELELPAVPAPPAPPAPAAPADLADLNVGEKLREIARAWRQANPRRG